MLPRRLLRENILLEKNHKLWFPSGRKLFQEDGEKRFNGMQKRNVLWKCVINYGAKSLRYSQGDDSNSNSSNNSRKTN